MHLDRTVHKIFANLAASTNCVEICSRKGGNIHDKVTTEILFFIMELLSFRIEEIIAVRNIVRCGNSGLCICKEEIDRRKSSSTARFRGSTSTARCSCEC